MLTALAGGSDVPCRLRARLSTMRPSGQSLLAVATVWVLRMSLFSNTLEVRKTDIQPQMQHAIVRHVESDVDNRLADLGLDRTTLHAVVAACVGAARGCTDNDPPGAYGYESYRLGTRRARELLRPKGWDKDDAGGYACVLNHKRRVRLVVMNADDGAGLVDRAATNRCRKGQMSERVSLQNQSQMRLEVDMPVPLLPDTSRQADGYETWHLCVHITASQVRAELSKLTGYQNGFFTSYIEKLILIAPGDWDDPQVKPTGDSGPDDGQDYDIVVKLK